MEGYLRIDVNREGDEQCIKCACKLEDANLFSRMRILHTVMEALNLSSFDFELYRMARESGMLDTGRKAYPKSEEELYSEG